MCLWPRSALGLAASALCTVSLQSGDGQIYFNNRIPGATLQVFHIKDDGGLDPLEPATRFRTESAATAYYVFGVTVVVPGVPAPVITDGDPIITSATFRVRAWEGADWASATLRAESNDVTLPVGGDFWPPTNLVGIEGLTLRPRVQLTLNLSGQMPLSGDLQPAAAQPVIVQSSPDLVTWQFVSQLDAAGPLVTFEVFASESKMFYRAVLP
jgi:hypothetical protein